MQLPFRPWSMLYTCIPIPLTSNTSCIPTPLTAATRGRNILPASRSSAEASERNTRSTSCAGWVAHGGGGQSANEAGTGGEEGGQGEGEEGFASVPPQTHTRSARSSPAPTATLAPHPHLQICRAAVARRQVLPLNKRGQQAAVRGAGLQCRPSRRGGRGEEAGSESMP